MFLQQRHAERVVPAPEAVKQIKRFEMELHAPVLHLPEIKYLVNQAKQDMHILFHQLEELARLSVEGAVGKKLLYGIGYQRQRSTEIVRNIREEHQLGMRSLLQFMGKLFQLRLLYFQQFLLLYQLGFLFLQFLFLHGQLTVQPVLGAQGEVDSHQQADQQQ